MSKTTQALKISASWTPSPEAAAKMMAAIDDSDLAGARIGGGRIALKHAIASDYADPDHAHRVSQRIFEIKTALSAHGTLHNFKVNAGAVPVEEAEVLPDPAAE